jgi:hypothetical protein
LNPYQFGGNNPVIFNDPTGALMERGEGRMQKGPDGNYHVPWLNELLWNNQGFFDLGENGGQGNGGGNYTHITGMNSEDVLSNMNFGDVFGKNKSGEYGFWRSYRFSPTDRGYDEAGASGTTLSEVSVGAGRTWVALVGFESGNSTSGLCPNSFIFQTIVKMEDGSGGWQVAGVSNVADNLIYYNGSTRRLTTTRIVLPVVFFGLPIRRKNGDLYSQTRAAEISDRAVKKANDDLAIEFSKNPAFPNVVGLSLYYRQRIDVYMRQYGGSATLVPPLGGEGIAINKAKYSVWCD